MPQPSTIPTSPREADAALDLRLATGGAYATSQPAVSYDGTSGIVYRDPVPGVLHICAGQQCPDATQATADHAAIVTTARVSVPQAGKIGYIPLDNGIFDKNSIAATFTEGGSLATLSFSTEAEAEKAVNTLSQTLDIVAKQQDLKRNARTEALKSDTVRVQAENDLLDAQIANEGRRRN